MTDYIFIDEFTVKINKRKQKFRYIFFIILFFMLMPMITSFIHELGHAITLKFYGIRIYEFHITYFPFVLDFSNPYVAYISSRELINFDIFWINASGSLFSLFIGIIFIALYYFFNLNKYIEFFFFQYSIYLILEMIIYIILDIFFMRMGDWYSLYEISPLIVQFSIIVYLLILSFLFLNMRKILQNLDIN